MSLKMLILAIFDQIVKPYYSFFKTEKHDYCATFFSIFRPLCSISLRKTVSKLMINKTEAVGGNDMKLADNYI